MGKSSYICSVKMKVLTNPVLSVWSKTGPTLLRLKGCLGNSLFVIQLGKRCDEILVVQGAAGYRKHLVTLEDEDLACVWVPFKILLNLESQQAGVVVGGHVEQNVVGLTNRLDKTIEDGTFALNGLQVVHTIDALPLKDEIGSTNALGIGKDEDTESMLNGPTGCTEQRGIVFVGLADGGEDVGLVPHQMELIPPCNESQLAGKVYATKHMKPGQFQGDVATILFVFFHLFLLFSLQRYEEFAE